MTWLHSPEGLHHAGDHGGVHHRDGLAFAAASDAARRLRDPTWGRGLTQRCDRGTLRAILTSERRPL